MAGLYLFYSNSQEELSVRLAKIIQEKPLRSPFSSNIFITGSSGMNRWISLKLAAHNSISANCQFFCPHDFFLKTAGSLKEYKEKSLYESQNLRWAVIKILKEGLLEKNEFLFIRRYVNNNYIKLYELSGKIAGLFSSYLTYRPELIKAWDEDKIYYEEDNNEIWQKMLWKKLSSSYGHLFLHNQKLKEIFLKKYIYKEEKNHRLAERIFIFGLSHIPPDYIDFFCKISKIADIYFFLFNPSRVYSKGKEEEYYKIHNLFFRNSGKRGNEFFSIIYRNPFTERKELFVDPLYKKETLLSHIQSHILSSEDKSDVKDKIFVNEKEESLKIVSCYSPAREVEVLYNFLLDLFNNDRTLKGEDIIVMAPHIEKYRPYIEAVLGSAEYTRKIPYSISDRFMRNEGSLADTFLLILNLNKSRFEVAGIMEIAKGVNKAFNLEGNIELLREWVNKVNIIWGIDGHYKEKLGLPGFEENTWKAGLKRMLLGYAMSGSGEDFFEDILPFDNIEGSGGQILGNFLNFIEALFEAIKEFETEKTLSEWAKFFKILIDTFFPPHDDIEEEIAHILNIIDELRHYEYITGFNDKLPFSVLNKFFIEKLEENISEKGFITGGVTFCSLKKGRVIPFRVICLLGMNDEVFPGKTMKLQFDLMSRYPKKGDENKREGNRYLFLETLLSAGDKLYISYTGKNMRDNSNILPSVLLDELIDYIQDRYSLKTPVTACHPLHSFSRDYFKKDSAFFSYSKEDEEASLINPGEKNIYTEEESLEIAETLLSFSLSDLCSFFRNPAKYFITRRLKAFFPFEKENIDETEPFNLSPIKKYIIENELIEQLEDGEKNEEKYFRRVRAEGNLPHGKIGKLNFDKVLKEAREFSEKIIPYKEEEPGYLDIDREFTIENYTLRITGKIEKIYKKGIVKYRPVKGPRAKDLIDSWIYHLFINMEKGHKKSYFIGKEKWALFTPPGNPEKIIESLLKVYLNGIVRFIPFMPEISYGCAKEFIKEENYEQGFDSFKNKLEDDWTGRGEKNDPYFSIYLNRVGNLMENDRFKKDVCIYANTFFVPLFRNYEEKKFKQKKKSNE